MSLPHQNGDSIHSGELRVLLLGPLRRQLNCDEFQIPCPADGSQESFWKDFGDRYPEVKGSTGSVRLARNSDFLVPEDKLMPGDQIALIPPVSGG